MMTRLAAWGLPPPRARCALPGFACTDTLLVYAGEIVKASFDLPISSTYFQAGHRYRITVSWKTISDEKVTPLAVADAPVIYVGNMAGISSATTDTDAASLDNLDTKWGIEIGELVEKINLLHGANVDALYTRVEEFWARPGIDLDEWAKY